MTNSKPLDLSFRVRQKRHNYKVKDGVGRPFAD
jgi:hypothetical protein